MMMDQIQDRMWVAHHKEFADWVDSTAATIRSGLSRFSAWDGSTHQLLALVAAFAITALNFNATAA